MDPLSSDWAEAALTFRARLLSRAKGWRRRRERSVSVSGAHELSTLQPVSSIGRSWTWHIALHHPGLRLKMPAWVFCMSWCPDFEFRGTHQMMKNTLLSTQPTDHA